MQNISVSSIHGIGQVKSEVLKTEAGIETVEDLLYYTPRRYIDRSHIKSIIDCFVNEEVTIAGNIIGVKLIRKKKSILQVDVSDGTDIIAAIFFNAIGFMQKMFLQGDFVLLSGRVSMLKSKQMVHPEFDFVYDKDDPKFINTGRIIPLYKSTNVLKKNGFDSRGFRRIIISALDEFSKHILDSIPDAILKKYNLLSMQDAINGIHFPENMEQAERARVRLAFNEIYFFQYYILLLKASNKKEILRNPLSNINAIDEFIKTLEFQLTKDQINALNEIDKDMTSPFPMNRLLQGDVGSGKTIVALTSSLIAINRGEQCALMAPTEILAKQHYETAAGILPENVKVALITGSISAKIKNQLYEDISQGEIDLVIGTHALIQSGINFKSLGYIIIDEQHRFGVEQRAKLRTKGEATDLLIMTATPIPRSLAMTLYGDLDVSYIREKPANRLPIKTLSFPYSRINGVYNSMRNYINQGRQIFYVLPIIEESEKIDLNAAVTVYNNLKDKIFKDMNVALLHGKISPDEKESIMSDFKTGDIDILVSTTVIEVGIDIPNANVMVIEHAERFGLAQLHQLRGRIGRGEHQSFCILIYPENITDNAAERIRTLTEVDDGFILSEKDLQLRGGGQIIGTRQHGFSLFEFADIGVDLDIINNAREEAVNTIAGLSDITSEFNNLRLNRFNKQMDGLRKKKILSILS
ncbi:MAG: ATP-dependent DNA helicase RecG [Leptospirales bacterium]|nr:ATP-dependent DNA helicase RecG [Leptospirales bacterium]